MQAADTLRRAVALISGPLLTFLASLALATLWPSAAPAETGRFHHLHMRVADVAKTEAFYGKVFGLVPVLYAGKQPALAAETSFIFLDKAEAPTISPQLTGLLHIGWSGVDGPSEYAWLQSQGVQFHTPLSPFPGGHYMYLLGPDHEVAEIWTPERHHRLNHVHLIAADPRAVAQWFARIADAPSPRGANVKLGTVTIHVLPDAGAFHPKERTGPIQPTDGSTLDHIALSFRDIDAAWRRVKASGEPIVRPLSADPMTGARHFFVRAPNGVLVEMIRARPWPEAAWE